AAGGGAKRRAVAKRTSSRASSHGGPLAALGRDLSLPLPVPDWSKPIIALLVLVALALALRSWLLTRRAKRLEAREHALLRDLDVMQAALVPEVPASLGGLDVSVAYRPAEGPAAGGDFYDVFALDEHRVAVMLGDVTGHGHEALQRAALTRYTLRTHLHEGRLPRAALARTSHTLADPRFAHLATVAVAVFDRRRGTLTYALAGHPPPILLGTGVADAPLACSSPPLGWDVPTGQRQRTVSLPAGARACFFSDGLIEARCAPSPDDGRRTLLGTRRLRELIESLAASEGAPQLLHAVREQALATPDDMAACILTARAGAPARVDLEELELDPAALERGRFDSYLRGCGLSRAEAAQVIARVRAQLAGTQTAIVLVDRCKGAPRARVTAPGGSDRTLPDAPELLVGS
ncbi:MAG TPA: PP2C family protein-serine/threonine phosphatase, partial [Solirubrobacteraceae bacterium]